jgi:hypothetical protein
MRTPHQPGPRHTQRPIELDDLLALDAVWAMPPPDLLDDVLAAIERQHEQSHPGLQHQEPLEAGVNHADRALRRS